MEYDLSRIVGVLDQYLLTEDVRVEDLVKFLERLKNTPWNYALKQAGLQNGIPEDEDQALTALVILRVGIANVPPPGVNLLIRLKKVCLCSRIIKHYIREDINRSRFETYLENVGKRFFESPVSDIEDGSSCDTEHELHLILNDLRYCLSMIGAPIADGGKERIDAVAVCIKTVQRLERYWYAVLG